MLAKEEIARVERTTEVKIVVQKFGGSSVADPQKLGQVADRVAETVRSGKRVVVVVSAMGKTTDQLLELARSVAASPPRRELDMLLSTGISCSSWRARSPPRRRAASSTCCSRRASASRWRFSRWRSRRAGCRRSRSPARSRAS
jgi:hypothetical protein